MTARLTKAKLQRWLKQANALHAKSTRLLEEIEGVLGADDRRLVPLASSAMCASDELAGALSASQSTSREGER